MAWLLLYTPTDAPLARALPALAPDATEVAVLAPGDPFRALEHAEARVFLEASGGLGADTEAFVRAALRLRPSLRLVFEARDLEEARRLLSLGVHEILPASSGPEILARRIGAWRADALGRPVPSAAGAPPAEGASGPANGGAVSSAESPAGDLDGLSLFVRGLAHEVNNPLTTIRGFLQLLLHDEGARDPKEALEAYRTMEAESRRIAEVVQELEYFSGMRRPARTLVDLERVLSEAAEALKPHRIEWSLPSPAPALLADREQVSLALRHLLGYLAETSPENPARVDVRVEESDGRVAITAESPSSAAGPGAGTRLLVPLYTGPSDSGKRRSLAVVFGIARAHGGRLDVSTAGDRLKLRLELPTSTSATDTHELNREA